VCVFFRRYNTTLKAILVLPDPRDKSTYPSTPYPAGSDVIALYPDTTSFYRAKVIATPTPGKVSFVVVPAETQLNLNYPVVTKI